MNTFNNQLMGSNYYICPICKGQIRNNKKIWSIENKYSLMKGNTYPSDYFIHDGCRSRIYYGCIICEKNVSKNEKHTFGEIKNFWIN